MFLGVWALVVAMTNSRTKTVRLDFIVHIIRQLNIRMWLQYKKVFAFYTPQPDGIIPYMCNELYGHFSGSKGFPGPGVSTPYKSPVEERTIFKNVCPGISTHRE